MDLKNYIARIKDFPSEGVDFKDVTPLLNDVEAYRYTIEKMSEFVKACGATVIVAPEARGFIFAAPVAFNTGVRLVLVRKPGKLPRECHKVAYSLEYGNNVQEMHKGDVHQGDKVVILDDVLATGGTIKAIIKMVEKEAASVEGICFLADLRYLHEPEVLAQYRVESLLTYED